MIDYPYIPEPIHINYEEREMGKTVTVMEQIELPDGYALAEPVKRPPVNGEVVLLHEQALVWNAGTTKSLYPILRPSATEKTLEMPECIKGEWLTHDNTNGFTIWKFGEPILPCNKEVWTGVNTMVALRLEPSICKFNVPSIPGPPAARIWRIVERGQE